MRPSLVNVVGLSSTADSDSAKQDVGKMLATVQAERVMIVEKRMFPFLCLFYLRNVALTVMDSSHGYDLEKICFASSANFHR